MAAPSSRLSLSSVKTSGSEAYYKSNLDLVLKENKQLRQRLDQLEKENRGLKKAVYDLSVRCASTYLTFFMHVRVLFGIVAFKSFLL